MDAEPPPDLPPPPKKEVSTGCIVSAVLTILAALVLAVSFGGIVDYIKNSHLNTRSDMKGLEIAIKGYQTEYLRLPSPPHKVSIDVDLAFDTTDSYGRALLEVLLAVDTSRNPRHIRFWEAPPARENRTRYSPDTGLKDSWGQLGYRIVLDYDGDGLIADPEGTGRMIKEPVILYSAGEDGDFATWKDNIRSWE